MNFQGHRGRWDPAAPAAANRRLAWALVFSAALHVLYLWPKPLPRLVSPRPALVGRITRTPAAPAAQRAPAAAALSPASPRPKGQANAGTETPALLPAANPPAIPPPPRAEEDDEAGVDRQQLSAYLLALAHGASAARTYPPMAIAQGLSGTVDVGVRVAPHAPPLVYLLKSSGEALLDGAALATVTDAVRRTPLPEGLVSREVTLRVPLVFELPAHAATP